MHYVYILYSYSIDSYYIGESVNPDERLNQHNSSSFKRSSTAKAHDWKIVFVISVRNRSEARVVESYIKSMKSRKFLSNICNSPEFYKKFRKLVLEKFSISILD